MSVIHILPDEVANRIAAGEVIERPASVVKELVENAIDAGAKRIAVQAREGGRSLIQVVDDGCGMDRDDALLCLEPHATSKLRVAADMEHIATLGFRGEALPSIASVSRFHLQTRRPEDLSGNEVIVDGGTMRELRECGCAPGSSIRVRQLFFNMPGRRKFLRGAETEGEHIQEIVLLQALAHPEIAFDLVLDEQPVIQVAAAADLGTRVAMLLGRDVFSALLPVDYEEAGLRVSGFVARPGLTRATRREQRFFVNGRPAIAESVYAGVREAYHTLVMKGRYPPVVLVLRLDPERVDVNVHPAKREVRFRENALVAQIVAAAVRRALRGLAGDVAAGSAIGLEREQARWSASRPAESATPAPAEADGQPPGVRPPPPFELQRPAEQVPLPWSLPATRPLAPEPPTGSVPPQPQASAETAPAPQAAAALGAAAQEGAAAPAESANTAPAGGTSPSTATRAEIRDLRVIGVLNSLYLVAESRSGLVLIDQHAAHERILFERLLKAAAAQDAERQPLLLPVTLDLAPADAALLRRSLEHFQRLGFGLETFGGNTFLVNAVPARFPHENLAGLLRDVLDELRQSAGTMPRFDEVQIAQAACKHAVKAEDPLAPAEITRLLADLAETDMPYTCPHGRPVMITLPHAEIERRFGRRA